MAYNVEYVEGVEKDLAKLDKALRLKVINKIEHYLAKDPEGLGKPLTGVFKGFWRYRFENYRIIYRIRYQEILISVFRIAHRKNVYSKPISS